MQTTTRPAPSRPGTPGSADDSADVLLGEPLRPIPRERTKGLSSKAIAACATVVPVAFAALFPLFTPFPAAVVAIVCLVGYLHHTERVHRYAWMSLALLNLGIGLLGVWLYLFLPR